MAVLQRPHGGSTLRATSPVHVHSAVDSDPQPVAAGGGVGFMGALAMMNGDDAEVGTALVSALSSLFPS